MAAEFFRTARALDSDGQGRRLLVLAVGAIGLLAWLAWSVLARVPIFALSTAARLEVSEAVQTVEAPVSGTIISKRGLALGAEVTRGEVLVELDSEEARLGLAEQETRMSALQPEITSLKRELEAEMSAREQAGKGSALALAEARSRLKQAEASERLASIEESRLGGLHSQGQISEVEYLRANTKAQLQRANADSARLAVARLEKEGSTGRSDRQAHIESLTGKLVRLEGELVTAQAVMERLQHAVDRRLIRSPSTGRLAEIASAGVGTVVSEGTRLASIVPTGEIGIVASFEPRIALGRVKQGQPARMRLEGFTWTQYGSLPASVTQVAGEVRDGRVRVELSVQPSTDSPLPLEHGLPGSIEVEVERISPATLLLRTAGKLITRPTRGGAAR